MNRILIKIMMKIFKKIVALCPTRAPGLGLGLVVGLALSPGLMGTGMALAIRDLKNSKNTSQTPLRHVIGSVMREELEKRLKIPLAAYVTDAIVQPPCPEQLETSRAAATPEQQALGRALRATKNQIVSDISKHPATRAASIALPVATGIVLHRFAKNPSRLFFAGLCSSGIVCGTEQVAEQFFSSRDVQEKIIQVVTPPLVGSVCDSLYNECSLGRLILKKGGKSGHSMGHPLLVHYISTFLREFRKSLKRATPDHKLSMLQVALSNNLPNDVVRWALGLNSRMAGPSGLMNPLSNSLGQLKESASVNPHARKQKDSGIISPAWSLSPEGESRFNRFANTIIMTQQDISKFKQAYFGKLTQQWDYPVQPQTGWSIIRPLASRILANGDNIELPRPSLGITSTLTAPAQRNTLKKNII